MEMKLSVVTAERPAGLSVAQNEPVGDTIARVLADIGVTTAFGVISIHNMPILDAIARQGRFVSCRRGVKPAR